MNNVSLLKKNIYKKKKNICIINSHNDHILIDF